MRRLTWSRVIDTLVMVRLGQELGTTSELAQAIAHSIDAVVSVLARICS